MGHIGEQRTKIHNQLDLEILRRFENVRAEGPPTHVRLDPVNEGKSRSGPAIDRSELSAR